MNTKEVVEALFDRNVNDNNFLGHIRVEVSIKFSNKWLMFFLRALPVLPLQRRCAASAQQDGHELGKPLEAITSDVFFVHTSHEHDINMLARCSIRASTRIQGNVVVYSNADNRRLSWIVERILENII